MKCKVFERITHTYIIDKIGKFQCCFNYEMNFLLYIQCMIFIT